MNDDGIVVLVILTVVTYYLIVFRKNLKSLMKRDKDDTQEE